MTTDGFHLSPWTPEQTAVLEAWGHDRHGVLQAGLDAAVALMRPEGAWHAPDFGPVVVVGGEGDTTAALFADILDDLMALMAVHGHFQVAVLDGVLKRDREGFVAWGFLSLQDPPPPEVEFERAGDVEVVAETPEEIRLRATLRRLT